MLECYGLVTAREIGEREVEMARLGMNVLGISETRWPKEDDYG